MGQRLASVTGFNVSAKVVANYLPSNYQVVGTYGDGILIAGEDDHGWTLDDYVIPRLASGLLVAKEIAYKDDPRPADVTVSNQGSLWVFEAVSDDAWQWVQDNVEIPDHLWVGPHGLHRFAVEHRFGSDLVAGIREAGYVVKGSR